MKPTIIIAALFLLAGTAWGQTGITDTARTEYKWDEERRLYNRVVTYPTEVTRQDIERRLGGLQAERNILLSIKKKALTEDEVREIQSLRDRDMLFADQLDARIEQHERLIQQIQPLVNKGR